MVGRILVPLDANKNAEHIVPYAALLARTLDEPVMLLTVAR